MRVALVGASGFIGKCIHAALERRGHEVVGLKAPRLSTQARTLEQLALELAAEAAPSGWEAVASRVTAVVNAAGISNAASTDEAQLFGANALLPALIHRVFAGQGVRRTVHVSSAAVQGPVQLLDESASWRPFSPYSWSKARGEELLLATAERGAAVIYRPTSVHGPTREVTQRLARLCASPLASVANDGTQPTPQVLVGNVADAAAYVATVEAAPPAIVLHPSEGLTVRTLVQLLGEREPRRIPGRPARLVLRGFYQLKGSGVATARRLEMLWFGQEQVDGWLTTSGWKPPEDRDAWIAMREEISRIRRHAR